MPETRGELRTPVGFRDDGTVRALALTDDDELKVSANATVLADILTALQLIDDLRNALDSVGTDELDVNVEASVLPTGAATAAHQATMITALELIDDLRGCLNSVDTDVFIAKVSASVLPVGAATSAKQDTMITALQLIDDLRGALDSVDTDELVVNVDESVLPTGAATSANQGAQGSKGWIDGAWQRSPIPFGASNSLGGYFSETSLPAGSSWVNDSAVSAGQIQIVTTHTFQAISASITRVRIEAYINGASYAVWAINNPVSGDYYQKTLSLTLFPGDYLRLRIEGATLNDDVYSWYGGYIMDSAE